MKTIRDFLCKHALLLLAALVVVSVPVGGALGKYVGSVTVTSGLKLTVDAKPVTSYTYNLKNGNAVRKILSNNIGGCTIIRFCRTPPTGATVVPDVNLGLEATDNIQLYKNSNTLYVTPNKADAVMVFNSKSSSMFGSGSSGGLKVSEICFDDNAIDTSKVTEMKYMFAYCGNLSNIKFGTSFKTTGVTDMNHMFSRCEQLSNIDLSSFNFSSVTNLSYLFSNCSALTTIQFPARVEPANGCDMAGMFVDCTSLTTLDLSMFYTNKVTGMLAMFSSCTNLTTIYASDGFVIQAGCKTINMFGSDAITKCVNLVGGNGTKCADGGNPLDGTYARIDRPSQPGYFTDINATRSLTYSATGTDREANGFGITSNLAS